MKLTEGVVYMILLVSLIFSAEPKRKSKKYNKSRSRAKARSEVLNGGVTYQSQVHNAEFVVGMVKLYQDYFEYICAGVIITEYWALTSYTCANIPTREEIVLGKVVLRGGTKWIEGNGGFDHLIDDILAHLDQLPGFIKVKNGFINYPYESRVPLIASPSYSYAAVEAEMFGWAEAVNAGVASEVLQTVTVDIISYKECRKYYPEIDHIGIPGIPFLVCGISINGFFCDSHGGAPLVSGNVLIGISVKVDNACDANHPMVFFRISLYTWAFEFVVNDTRLNYSPPF